MPLLFSPVISAGRTLPCRPSTRPATFVAITMGARAASLCSQLRPSITCRGPPASALESEVAPHLHLRPPCASLARARSALQPMQMLRTAHPPHPPSVTAPVPLLTRLLLLPSCQQVRTLHLSQPAMRLRLHLLLYVHPRALLPVSRALQCAMLKPCQVSVHAFISLHLLTATATTLPKNIPHITTYYLLAHIPFSIE